MIDSNKDLKKKAFYLTVGTNILFFILLALFILMSLGTMAEQTLTSSKEKDTTEQFLL